MADRLRRLLLQEGASETTARGEYIRLNQVDGHDLSRSSLDDIEMAGLDHDTAMVAGLSEIDRKEADVEKRAYAASSHEPDDDLHHAGLEFPTDEDRRTLVRVADKIPWTAYMIALIELAERFSYYGSTVVFTNFIQQSLPSGQDGSNARTGAGGPNGQSGALGLGQRTATGLTTFNQFWVYVIPLLGAYVADTYWGRYKTICVSVVIALVGHCLLVVSSVPSVIQHPDGALACFVVAIVIMGVGTGGFKSNISPLVAEQYTRTKQFIGVGKHGERVIVDPTLTTSRIYMYFYLFINVGALVGQITMTYSEKYVGFYMAFLLPTAVFLLCPIVLAIGRKRYVSSPPQGSVLATSLKLWSFAASGGFSGESRWTANPRQTFRNLTGDDFWEAAKPSHARGQPRPTWMTFDDVWVDEVKRGLKACTVFCWYPIYWLTYNQLNNNLTSQAATMMTHGLPNDVLSNLDPLALIIFIPIFDQILYPFLRLRLGMNFTPLKKITLGFYTGAAGMVWAAVVQHYIYKTNPCGHHAATCKDDAGNALVSPLNVWIQSGSYILVAFSEILAAITGLEYAYTKAPKNMRSLVMSVYLFMQALSAALGEAFVSLSTDPLLVWNYATMGALAFVAGTLFWLAHRHLDAKEDALNNLDDDESNNAR